MCMCVLNVCTRFVYILFVFFLIFKFSYGIAYVEWNEPNEFIRSLMGLIAQLAKSNIQYALSFADCIQWIVQQWLRIFSSNRLSAN